MSQPLVDTCSVVVLGDNGVGKTSISTAFAGKTAAPTQGASGGAQLFTRQVGTHDWTCVVQLWDVHVRPRRLFDGWFGRSAATDTLEPLCGSADACVICYDVSRAETWDSVQGWWERFLAMRGPGAPRVPLIIIGNKTDLQKREVAAETVKRWCDSQPPPVLCFETSARSGRSIDPIFDCLADAVRRVRAAHAAVAAAAASIAAVGGLAIPDPKGLLASAAAGAAPHPPASRSPVGPAIAGGGTAAAAAAAAGGGGGASSVSTGALVSAALATLSAGAAAGSGGSGSGNSAVAGPSAVRTDDGAAPRPPLALSAARLAQLPASAAAALGGAAPHDDADFADALAQDVLDGSLPDPEAMRAAVADLDSIVGAMEAEAAEAARVVAERRAALEEAEQTHATLRAQLLRYARRRLALQRRLDRLYAVGAADRLQITLEQTGALPLEARVTGRVSVLATAQTGIPAIAVVVALVGEVELRRRFTRHEFFVEQVTVHRGGLLDRRLDLPFDLRATLPHESYDGRCVAVRYFVRATVIRDYGTGENLVFAVPVTVTEPPQPPLPPPPLPPPPPAVQEIGDCKLRVRLEPLAGCRVCDTIRVHVVFDAVAAGITAAVALYRAESWLMDGAVQDDCINLTYAKLCDGTPTRGQSYVVSFPLAQFTCTPTLANVADLCSVRYFVNVVLLGVDGTEVGHTDTEILLSR